jgi:two-component system nitrogen regulation response regulator NtrX
MDRVRSLIAKVAPSRLPILIQGETGTGKELVAGALHAQSGRRGRLVAFNVGAIPETIFESTVFGHVRGAFTGAVQDAEGYLAEADHGTAFFDEIGTLGAAAQAKLLRALETGTYRPVGARRDRRSDFRIVAACNELLVERVRDGVFRLDLMQRLSGCVIVLPPLRERPDDVTLLARHFADDAGVHLLHFTPDALRVLRDYHWPGNVRELRMFVERIIAVANPSSVTQDDVREFLLEAHRQSALVHEPRPTYVANPAGTNGVVGEENHERPSDDAMWRAIRAALQDADGNTTEAARRLGIHRSTLYRRMKQAGIAPERRVSRATVAASSTDSRESVRHVDASELPAMGKAV